MDIKQMEESFLGLQNFSDSQYRTINDLQVKVAELQSENQHLQQLLASNVPHLGFETGTLGISNEQLICETQIHLLKEQAVTRQLNADETKRFATFVDVLQKIKSKGEEEDVSVKKLPTDNLLLLLKQDDSANAK